MKHPPTCLALGLLSSALNLVAWGLLAAGHLAPGTVVLAVSFLVAVIAADVAPW